VGGGGEGREIGREGERKGRGVTAPLCKFLNPPLMKSEYSLEADARSRFHVVYMPSII